MGDRGQYSPGPARGEFTESTLPKPVARMDAASAAYWVFTMLFCLQMSFTAYAQLRLPQVGAAFAHLAVGDGVEAWGWAAGTLLLWGASLLVVAAEDGEVGS